MAHQTIEAEFAGGVLRPLAPLDLSEGQRVTVILSDEDPWDPEQAKAAMAEITNLPSSFSGPAEDRTSQNHDDVLYKDSE
jgi:predicted DNA-binding antitoxin AbrB/MazE fold protein